MGHVGAELGAVLASSSAVASSWCKASGWGRSPGTDRLEPRRLGRVRAARSGGTLTPWYHFVGGVLPHGDTAQIPLGLRFTSIVRWNRFLAGGAPYEPLKLLADASAVTCADGSTPRFDARLSQARVPVVYVGAAGGFGTYGLYSACSAPHDIESTIVRLRPPGLETTDFGHVDLFHAHDADRLVWTPIANWLLHQDESR